MSSGSPSQLQPFDTASATLETAARPLLRLAQYITGMETSFITAIDWEAQQQDVLFSLNSGAMQIPENITTDWSDSMCRSMFLAGQAASDDVGSDVPATCNATQAGMKSFVVVPILDGGRPIGTVCGASHQQIQLHDQQVEALQCIGDALQQLLLTERGKILALRRAEQAEAAAAKARDDASQQAIDYQKMAQLAHTDELTHLPNRRAFRVRMEEALTRSGRRHRPIGMVLVDVDRFKAINDTLGHLGGDEVLGAVAAALRQTARTQDLVARLGGDEFAMLIDDASRDEVAETARSIQERFAQFVAPLRVEATVSIGIAHSDDSSRHQLLANADVALYDSKGAGGARATVYRPGQTGLGSLPV